MEMDPFYLAPLGADAVSFAALQARALLDAKLVDERQMADVAVRTRAAGKARSYSQVTGEFNAETLLQDDYVRAPLRRHDLPPITDGAVALVIARADKAREICEKPVFITGFAHFSEAHYPGMRDLTVSPSTTKAAKAAGIDRPDRGGGDAVGVHPRGVLARLRSRPGQRHRDQPVWWPAGGQPDHGDRPGPDRRGGRAGPRQRQAPHAGAFDLWSVPAAKPGVHSRGRCQV